MKRKPKETTMTCLPPSGTKKLLVSKGVGNFEVCLQPAFVGRLFLRDPMFVQFEGVPAFFSAYTTSKSGNPGFSGCDVKLGKPNSVKTNEFQSLAISAEIGCLPRLRVAISRLAHIGQSKAHLK